MPTLLGEFSTALGQRRSTSLGDRESLSRPCPFGDARVIAFRDVPGTPEFVQLAVLTTTRVTASIRSVPLCRSMRSSIARSGEVSFKSPILDSLKWS